MEPRKNEGFGTFVDENVSLQMLEQQQKVKDYEHAYLLEVKILEQLERLESLKAQRI